MKNIFSKSYDDWVIKIHPPRGIELLEKFCNSQGHKFSHEEISYKLEKLWTAEAIKIIKAHLNSRLIKIWTEE